MSILEGFEVVNLVHGKGDSVMTVSPTSLKFNKATAVELNFPPFVKVLVNAVTRQVAIAVCTEKDPNAIAFSHEASKQNYAITVKVPAVQTAVRKLLDGKDSESNYSFRGELYPDEQVIIYNITEAKMAIRRGGRRKKSAIKAEDSTTNEN